MIIHEQQTKGIMWNRTGIWYYIYYNRRVVDDWSSVAWKSIAIANWKTKGKMEIIIEIQDQSWSVIEAKPNSI